ncbi:hypothetical protein CYMTET_32960 [Cymbomonas tetramitiformis]|uniref:Uncharacterized protein n=1 Tax=Cymbomonas tetramitiformis TaxID=36881 RepID=A0AAE0FED2_9CHLO|nr:hypothetical protein CYMTET_32960 [Cymbomonas tetramitiformis]
MILEKLGSPPKPPKSPRSPAKSPRVSTEDRVHALISLLRSDSSGDIDNALTALSILAAKKDVRNILWAEGVVELVLKLISDLPEAAQEPAIKILVFFTESSQERSLLLSNHAHVASIFTSATASDRQPLVCSCALTALRNLSRDVEGRDVVFNCDGLEQLVALLESSSEADHRNILHLLKNLCLSETLLPLIVLKPVAHPLVAYLAQVDNQELRGLAVSVLRLLTIDLPDLSIHMRFQMTGAVKIVMELLSEGSPGNQMETAGLLVNLTSETGLEPEVAKHGGVNIILKLMRGETLPWHILLLTLVTNLSTHDELEGPIVALGGVDLLGDQLHNQEFDCKRLAAGALRNLSIKANSQDILVTTSIITGLTDLVRTKDPEGREFAAATMRNLAAQSAASRELFKAAGAILPLVGLLRDGTESAKEEGAAALGNLAADDPEVYRQMAAAGCIPLLTVLLIKGVSNSARVIAGRTLHSMLADPALEEQLVMDGAIAAFAALLKDNLNAAADQLALEFIENMSENHPGKVVKADVVPYLVRVLYSATDAKQILVACSALGNLAVDKAAHRDEIARCGGIKILLRNVKISRTNKIKSTAMWALTNLATDHEKNQEALVQCGAVDVLLEALREVEDQESREEAIGTLAALATTEHVIMLIEKAGALKDIVEVLISGSEVGQLNAARAAQKLCLESGVDTRVAEAGVIPPLVRLLDAGDGLTRSAAAGALRSLTGVSPFEAWVAAEGAVEPLMRLLENGIDEAKANSAACLGNLFYAMPETRKVLAKTGVGCVMEILRTGTAESKMEVAGLIRNLLVQRPLEMQLTELGGMKMMIKLVDKYGRAMGVTDDGTVEKELEAQLEGPDAYDRLIELLDANDPAAKIILWKCMNNLITDANVVPQVIEAGVVELMVRFLNECDEGLDLAAGVLRTLAQDSGQKTHILDANAVPILVRLLEVDDPLTQIESAGALGNLTVGLTESRRLVAENGGIPPLVALLVIDNRELVQVAAGAIRNLTNDSTLVQQFVEANVMPPLIGLMRFESGHAIRISAAGALGNLTLGDESAKLALTAAGILPPFIRMLGEGSGEEKRIAVGALRNLATQTEVKAKIFKLGGVTPLVKYLQTSMEHMVKHKQSKLAEATLQAASAVKPPWSTSPAQHLPGGSWRYLEDTNVAVATMSNLAENAQGRVKQQIAEAGGIVPLVKLLHQNTAHSALLQEGAAAALVHMTEEETIRHVVADTGGIKLLCR